MAKPSDSITVEFTTSRFDTGAATNADSTPTGTFARNGTDDGTVTVTCTNIDTGRYKAAFTIPSGAASGDICSLSIAATVNSVAGKGIVWQSQLDTSGATLLSRVPPQAHQVGTATGTPTTSAVSLTGLTGNVANRACYWAVGSVNAGEWNEITGGTASSPTFYRAWSSAPAAGDQLVVLGLVK